MMTMKLESKRPLAIGYSLLLTLPKMWTNYHRLSKKDRIELEITDDGDGRALVLRPMKKLNGALKNGKV